MADISSFVENFILQLQDFGLLAVSDNNTFNSILKNILNSSNNDSTFINTQYIGIISSAIQFIFNYIVSLNEQQYIELSQRLVFSYLHKFNPGLLKTYVYNQAFEGIELIINNTKENNKNYYFSDFIKNLKEISFSNRNNFNKKSNAIKNKSINKFTKYVDNRLNSLKINNDKPKFSNIDYNNKGSKRNTLLSKESKTLVKEVNNKLYNNEGNNNNERDITMNNLNNENNENNRLEENNNKEEIKDNVNHIDIEGNYILEAYNNNNKEIENDINNYERKYQKTSLG